MILPKGYDIQRAIDPYLTDGYYYDEDTPAKVVNFLQNYCSVTKDGALFKKGDPMRCRAWQLDVIFPVFGIKRKEDGFDRFEFVWVEIPKKNGKTGLLSGLNLYQLQDSSDKGGVGVGVANTRKQAKMLLEDSKVMIELNPHLNRIFDIRQYSIRHPKTRSIYEIVAAEESGSHGENVSYVLWDEIHAASVDHKVQSLWQSYNKAGATRANFKLFSITNSGIEGSYPHHLHLKANKIKQGLYKDDRWFVMQYNLPREAELTEENYAKVNPTYGNILPKKYFQGLMTEVKNDPLEEATIRRLNFGQWVKSTQSWNIANIWSRGDLGPESLEDYKGYECIIGIDLADGRDLCAASIIIPPTFYLEDGTPYLFTDNNNKEFKWFHITWTPSAMVDRRVRDENIHFKHWIDAGLVNVTSGDFRDSERIALDIIEEVEGLEVVRVGFDRAKADIVVPRLMEAGMECEPWPQTPLAMDNVVQKMDELITNKMVNHQGNPVLEWQIGNVELYSDREGNRWVHKTKSTEKIDGIVSFLNGMKSYMEMIREPEVVSDPSTWIS